MSQYTSDFLVEDSIIFLYALLFLAIKAFVFLDTFYMLV